MTYKTPGIVLKRINFREADRILTIFTERFGKIKAIAKGVRKTKSKLAGSLEPFMLVDLQLHEGKTFFIVTGAVIVEELPKLHSDLVKTSQAFYISELVDRFAEESQHQPGIFHLYYNGLKSIEESSDKIILKIFELKLIEAAGFRPQLYECVHCKKKLEPGNNFWDEVEGGVICSGCQGKYRHGRAVSDNAIKLLRLIEKNDFTMAQKLKLSKILRDELDDILSRYIENILEKELKAERFMRELQEK